MGQVRNAIGKLAYIIWLVPFAYEYYHTSGYPLKHRGYNIQMIMVILQVLKKKSGSVKTGIIQINY